jgi:catechol 2,3-dioxygenase-like lactoylglutathione lyase family enzyme
MFKAIDHINLVVSDLEKAKEFFESFGFTVEHEGDLSGGWISEIVGLKDVRARYSKLALSGSVTKLELVSYTSPTSERDPDMSKANQLGFRHIAFEVDDIDDIVATLTDRGIEFMSKVQTYEPTKKRLVYFYGPEGILLELAQYG